MLSQKDPWLALMVNRDMPIAATGASPSQLMMGRHLHTTPRVPSATREPSWPDRETILVRDEKYKISTWRCQHQQHGARPLDPLLPGTHVLAKTNDKKDLKEIVQGEADSPRSYKTETKPGGMQQRNRRHLQNMPPIVLQPEATEKSSSLVKPDSLDKSDSFNKPNESATEPSRPLVQEPRRSGRNVREPERLIEQEEGAE